MQLQICNGWWDWVGDGGAVLLGMELQICQIGRRLVMVAVG